MKEVHTLFAIAVVVALVLFLFVSAEARMNEGCQCYFNSECIFDEQQHGYRYHQCFGACAAYSGWRYDGRCINVTYVHEIMDKPKKN